MGIDINNQVALVTGANRGIGTYIAETLIAQGAAKVYAAVRNPDTVSDLVKKHGDKLVPLQMDLTDAESIEAAARLADDVTVLVNNAGVLRNSTALDESAFEDLAFEMDVNVYGLLRVAQAFAPVLKANGGGALVQLNSVASVRGFPRFSTYCASKAAAYSLTQTLRLLLQEQGTQVLSVHPGPIATDMGDAAGFGDFAESPQLVADAIVAGLRSGDFHVFPDSFAQTVGKAYAGYAQEFIEGDLREAATG